MPHVRSRQWVNSTGGWYYSPARQANDDVRHSVPDDSEYRVSSPRGFNRVSSLRAVRREALSQAQRIGSYDDNYEAILAYKGGPARFGEITVGHGLPDDLEQVMPRPKDGPRYSQPEGELVATLSGDEIAGDDITELRRSASAWYRDNLLGKTTKTLDGHSVTFSGRGLRKTTSKGEDLLRAVPAIKAIIETGRLIETRPGIDASTKAMHLYGGQVRVGERNFQFGVFVRLQPDSGNDVRS